jgi:2-dehydro-3-deoxygalactonokinase
MPREADRQFLSCDWGTSYFRLKRVLGGKVVARFQDENGCKRLHQTAGADANTRSELFERHLLAALDKVVPPNNNPTKPLPLIISGMASSTIGWLELPYARAPIPLDGANLKVETLTWKKPAAVSKSYLVSGVATRTDIMRGEEAEAIGLLNFLTNRPANLVLVLPGTHSKHLHVSEGSLRDFQTYMTGELYSVLSHHSVLAASVAQQPHFSDDAFHTGIDAALQPGLAASLFRTRTRQVLGKKQPEENAWFLSGLLIGSELKELIRAGVAEILLGGAPSLRDLYGKALQHLGLLNSRAFSDAECENAVVRGHEIILSHLEP